MMQYLKVKNWGEYQHYKDRCPPWIKLHAKILNDMGFTALSCASRGLLMQLWILASENEGKITSDLKEIRYRLRDNTIKQNQINSLIDKGFLIGCKQTLADAVPEERREETEGETETETKKKYLDTVTLTETEHQTLVKKYGFHHTTKAIVVLNNYKASSGKKYKSDYHAILSWAMEKSGGKPITPRSPPPDTICPDCKQPIKAGVCGCEPLTEEEKIENKKRVKEILEGLK